jgi:hypothetical protein
MAAQVAAAASGSAITGAAGMAAFALGTAPLMVAFGTAGSLIPRVWKQRMMSVLAIGVILFGVVFINRGLVATGAPVTFMTIQTAVIGGGTPAQAAGTTAADGVVEIPLVIENTKFVPQVVEIPADTPVRLMVDRREDVACSAQIYLPQLNILVDLAPNAVTPVDIPATAKGTYTLTCGMSMMSGQLVVGGAGAGSGLLGRPALWIVLAIAGAIGSLVVAQRRDARIASADKKHRVEAPAGLYGFSWLELGIIVATVAAAVIAGLSLGGSFK